ncbi:hypothetical protein [Aurantiacibacter sediminis]|uniref:Uncharacterized protein n=1 Tax=Aurantiacibacter sediminis TaxID=2793064 RepID=A0ABS0N1T0_9SPHN|nr:hypothetical protein [Aurantiacibacter sediminis]MBH5321902.1 hypothetical protein [Aurantiacibacter sediminis]
MVKQGRDWSRIPRLAILFVLIVTISMNFSKYSESTLFDHLSGLAIALAIGTAGAILIGGAKTLLAKSPSNIAYPWETTPRYLGAISVVLLLSVPIPKLFGNDILPIVLAALPLYVMAWKQRELNVRSNRPD